MKPTKLSFEQRYSDDSGVEIGVHYDETKTWEIVIESHGVQVSIERKHLSFLRDALFEIDQVLTGQP